MTWIFYTFAAAFLFTALGLSQKVIAIKSQNARAMAILYNGTGALIAIVIFFITGSSRDFLLPHQPKAWIALAIASFGCGMYERGRFVATKLLDASIFSIIKNISTLIAFGGSFFLYSESLTFHKLIGVILIIGALVAVSLKKGSKSSSTKGILIAVLISVMLGLGWMLDKLGALYFNPGTYNILLCVIPLLFILPPRIKPSIIKSEWKLVTWNVNR